MDETCVRKKKRRRRQTRLKITSIPTKLETHKSKFETHIDIENANTEQLRYQHRNQKHNFRNLKPNLRKRECIKPI